MVWQGVHAPEGGPYFIAKTKAGADVITCSCSGCRAWAYLSKSLEAGRLTLIIRQQESSSIATQQNTKRHAQIGQYGSREEKARRRGGSRTEGVALQPDLTGAPTE